MKPPLKRAKKGSVETHLHLRIGNQLAARVEKEAKRAGISVAEWIRRTLAEVAK